MKKLLLLDGNSMLFRAYYATCFGNVMRTSSGIPTNAIFSFAHMLTKAINDLQIDKIIVAFDYDKNNFRREIYPEYKGTRNPIPDDLIAQFPIVREYLKAVKIKTIEIPGLEADDIIGSLAKQTKDYKINILSSDKDMLQLIDDNITVQLMQKGISEMAEMNEKTLYERFQLTPSQIIDLKGLSGDKSDNIPGVTKVGDTTAIKLLNDFNSVEGVYENIDKISGKLKENLVNDKDKAFLSKQLATIKTDALIDVDIQECDFDFNNNEALSFYLKYELKSFVKDVEVKPVKKVQVKSEAITKIDFELNQDFCIFIQDDNVGLADKEKCYVISLDNCLKSESFKKWLNSDCLKTVYDLKSLYHLLDQYSLTINGKIVDMMVVLFLLDSKCKSFIDVRSKFDFYFDSEDQNVQLDLFSEKQVNNNVGLYAYQLNQIKQSQLDELEEKEMSSLYWDIEYPLIKVLFEMEKKGIKVDEEILDSIASQTQEKVDSLATEIFQLVGKEFNLNSPKRLGEVIYDDLALAKSTKKSTDASVLTKLLDKHPVIALILEYRKYSKFYSTYAYGLKKYISKDSRIHTSYNQCITETGRLSSSEPNLQNISVRNPETMIIRKAFIPDEGCVLVGADYSQVELRILASMANQENMIEAFKNDIDAHTSAAMALFNVSFEQVTPLMRRKAKAINFGIDYGMSDFGLAEQLHISINEARNYIEEYYKNYPNIRKFMDDTVNYCQENGYVSSLLKRRRYISEINSTNHSLRQFGQRAAMNAPIQASAADLIKVAMINVYNRLNKEGLKSKMILQIHDELILNVYLDEVDVVTKLVQEEMENAIKLKVPLKAEAVVGNNWLEVK